MNNQKNNICLNCKHINNYSSGDIKMGLFDWFKSDSGKEVLSDAVKVVSPVLAGAIGSPAASLAVGLISKYIIGDEKAAAMTTDDILFKLKNLTPEIVAQIKEAETEFLRIQTEYKLQIGHLQFQDTASARDMALKSSIKPQLIISIVVILSYLAIFYFISTNLTAEKEINQMMAGAFISLLGVMTTAIPTILSFWFGASKTDQENSHSNNISRMMEMNSKTNSEQFVRPVSKTMMNAANKDAVD